MQVQATNLELEQQSEKHGVLSFDMYFEKGSIQINVLAEGTIQRRIVFEYSEAEDSVVMRVHKHGGRSMLELQTDLLDDSLYVVSKAALIDVRDPAAKLLEMIENHEDIKLPVEVCHQFIKTEKAIQQSRDQYPPITSGE